MVIFLYGPDAYRLKQAKDDIVGRYKSKYSSGMNFFAVDLSESDGIDMLEGAFKSSSFFSEHRLIVSKNIFGQKTATERFVRQLKEWDIAKTHDITLVVAENLAGKELIAKNKELFKLLSSDKNIVKNIEPLSGAKLAEWARKEFDARGCSIESAALNSFLNMTGDDSWAIINEIEKLTAYRREGSINTQNIELLISKKIDLNIFDLIDAFSLKNKPRAFELLYREIQSGRDPYYILTMVIYQFRNLLVVKDLSERGFSEAEISKKSGLHHFVVKKCLNSMAKFQGSELKHLYTRLANADILIKSGEKDIRNILDSFILGSH